MRIVLVSIGAIVLAAVVFFGVVILASESGEVVTLRTVDGQGESHATRLWLIEHEGAEFVRTGHPDKLWFVRLRANPSVELEREGAISKRTAVVVHDAETTRGVNDVYEGKYGDANWIVALSGDAADRVVVRLDPEVP